MLNTVLWALDHPSESRKLNFQEKAIVCDDADKTAGARGFYTFMKPHCEAGLPSDTQFTHLIKDFPQAVRDVLTNSLAAYKSYKEVSTAYTMRCDAMAKINEARRVSMVRAAGTLRIEDYGDPEGYIARLRKAFRANVAATAESPLKVNEGFFSDDAWKFKTERIIPTEWEGLNRMLGGGVRCGTIGGFLCPSGKGKSTILHNIASQWVKAGQNVAYINIEMHEADISSYVLAPLCPSIPSLSFMRKEPVTARQLAKDDLAKTELGRIKFYNKVFMTDTLITAEFLYDTLRDDEEEQGYKFDAVIIDYINILDCDDKNDKGWENLERMTARLHEVAYATNWAIVSVWQTNRPSKDKDGTATIAGSFNALHKLDWMFSITRENGSDVSTIRTLKRRQDGEDIECRLLFTPEKKQLREVEAEDEDDGVTVNTVVDCDYIHNNLSQKDIITLIHKYSAALNINVPDEERLAARVSKRVGAKGYPNKKGFESKVAVDTVDLPALLKGKPVLGLGEDVIKGANLFNI